MLRFLWGDLTAAVWGVEHVQGPCVSSHGFKTWHSLKTDGDRESLQKLQPMRAIVGFAELSVPQWAGERSDPLRRTYSFSIPRCTFFFPHTCRTKTTRPDSARCISGVKVAERSTGGHLRVCWLAGATTSSHTAAEVIENKTKTRRAAAKRKKKKNHFLIVKKKYERRLSRAQHSKI